ncbi:MAG: Athe_2463 domain-containing protein [Bacillota bacterium]
MKKIYILILAAALLLCAAAAYAEPPEAQLLSLLNSPPESLDQGRLEQMTDLARKITNDELRPLNFNQDFYKEIDKQGRLLNGRTLYYYWVLAYGGEHGTYDHNQGEYRYLGYTALGESYTNWLFRPDFSGSIDINNANWIEKPEEKKYVNQFVTQIMGEKEELKVNNFDRLRSTQKYREHIAWGLYLLSVYQPDYYKLDVENLLDRDWENCVHILQPPTKYMFGAGRMFRWMPDGTMRYMDVPLLPDYLLQFDLSADITEESFRGTPGEVIESTATFALNKEAFYGETAKLRLYMKTAAGETELSFAPVDPAKKMNGNQYTFQPGEKLEVKFSFTVPSEPAEIVARIDRVSNMRYWIEKNTANNEDRAPLIVGQYDIKVEILPDENVFMAVDEDCATVSYNVRIARKDSTPGDIEVSLTVKDPAGNHTERYRLGAGYVDVPFDFPAAAGSYTMEAEAWPVGADDVFPNDNRDIITVAVVKEVLKTDSKIHTELIDGGPTYRR